ncbi:hypothetical protein E2F50_12250 [Rhizobium deserti]|uniref:Uncharacterized protein n=1 Tax=Rhizobium deserti TaxID=2547961 RepID=A0A4R5UGV4_9HYPH|nr:hypothetical protein [Rhizobium deserti]TDK35036.1 hypothetical protein E2F50_12250 [Rhizobium deserti]
MSSEMNAPITSRNLVRISGYGYRESIQIQQSLNSSLGDVLPVGLIGANLTLSRFGSAHLKRMNTAPSTGVRLD